MNTTKFTGGETAVKIGNDGQKMMVEFLCLVGWKDVSENVQFGCALGKKHQSGKTDRSSHNIDGTFWYNSPLNHADSDIVLCSAKHNQDGYADKSKIYSYLKDLGQALECVPKDFSFANEFETAGKRKVFKGLLFWVSSNSAERNESMIDQVGNGLVNNDEDGEIAGESAKAPHGIQFDSIYLVDNRKATFISSAIKTARSRFPGARIQFLFPHTGLNNKTEDLKAYGEVMPIQYINTSLLPIVIEQKEQVTILLFCDGDFEKEDLKRMIWLSNKIASLVGEIVIYFNNYDPTSHKEQETRTKQLFHSSPLTAKIKVSRTDIFEFLTLKEDRPEYMVEAAPQSAGYLKIKHEKPLAGEEDLDQVLPFGEMMQPIIASSILSESDLKSFLVRKGIYVGRKEKQSTVPLLSTLLLSPQELNTLKSFLRAKEDRVKSVPRQTSLGTNELELRAIATLIQEVVHVAVDSTVGLPINCTFHKAPSLQMQDDEIFIRFTLEKQNSTKDLITGKQHNEGFISVKRTSNGLQSQINYTSRESLLYGDRLFKRIEEKLLEEKVISGEFFSIRFDSFDNVGRINFLLRFLNMRGQSVFDDGRLEHIVVKPDNSISEPLPFDLESLKDKVSELAIRGRELDSVHYFQDDYKKALLMQRVKIKYAYQYGPSKGKCIVDLNFKDALTDSNTTADFQFTLEVIKGANNRGENLEKLTQQLSKEFSALIQSRF